VRPQRRTLTAEYKLRILAEVDKVVGIPGAVGAIVRREGLYSSALSDWRKLRVSGSLGALGPVKRGPKVTEPNPLSTQNAQLLRENKRLARQLERAEIVIDVQKKVAALLGLPPLNDGEP
jgi:transposase-like protein